MKWIEETDTIVTVKKKESVSVRLYSEFVNKFHKRVAARQPEAHKPFFIWRPCPLLRNTAVCV